MKKRGFITIATGKDEYYHLANNLLKSYRLFTKKALPFAILCDRVNVYTKDFDDVILFKNGATNSYLDKLSMGEYLPYEENIFIDADCLAYGDLNQIFEYFNGADDFSCFGRVLPLEDKTGWFEYQNIGELKSQVDYVVGLHGGIYFMKNSSVTKQIFDKAKEWVPNYSSFKFKGNFTTPGDEPLIALSMAVNKCKPVPFDLYPICCYWEYLRDIKLDISIPKATIVSKQKSTILVHWGTRYTKELQYLKQKALLDILLIDSYSKHDLNQCKKKYDAMLRREEVRYLSTRIIRKFKRVIRRVISK